MTRDQLAHASTCVGSSDGRWKTCVDFRTKIGPRPKSTQVNAKWVAKRNVSWTQVESLRWLAWTWESGLKGTVPKYVKISKGTEHCKITFTQRSFNSKRSQMNVTLSWHKMCSSRFQNQNGSSLHRKTSFSWRTVSVDTKFLLTGWVSCLIVERF